MLLRDIVDLEATYDMSDISENKLEDTLKLIENGGEKEEKNQKDNKEHCLEPKDWGTSLWSADKPRHAPSRSRASPGLLANASGAMTTDRPRSPDGLEQQPSEPESWQNPVLGMRSTATTSHALPTAQLKYKCTSTLLGRPLGQQLKRCCNRRWRAAQNLAPISVETDQNQLHMRLEGAITIGS